MREAEDKEGEKGKSWGMDSKQGKLLNKHVVHKEDMLKSPLSDARSCSASAQKET